MVRATWQRFRLDFSVDARTSFDREYPSEKQIPRTKLAAIQPGQTRKREREGLERLIILFNFIDPVGRGGGRSSTGFQRCGRAFVKFLIGQKAWLERAANSN